MSTAGGIEYKIGGDVSGLAKAFDQAQAKAASFNATLKRDIRGPGTGAAPFNAVEEALKRISSRGGVSGTTGSIDAVVSQADKLAAFRKTLAEPVPPSGPRDTLAFSAAMWDLGKSLGVVAAVGTAVRFSVGEIVSSFGNAADLQNTSEALGVSAENLQRLQYSFSQGGASAAQFTSALTNVSRLMGKAMQGDDGSLKAFSNMGISLAEIQQLSPDQMMLRVADAVNRAVDPSKQLALAQGVLGKSVRTLMPQLREGSEGIRKLMTDATVATNGQVAALEAASQAWENFWAKRESAKIAAQGQALKEGEELIRDNQLNVITGSLFVRASALIGGGIQGLMNKYLGTQFGVQGPAGALDTISPERLAAGNAPAAGEDSAGGGFKMKTDALQGIGLYVGSGGPAGEALARETARNTARMAKDMSQLVAFVLNKIVPGAVF